MKKTLLYIAALMLGSVALTSCDGDLERPPMVVPEATIKANTSIAQLKADFYTSEFNYATQVGVRADGEHYIIEGRVVTSDQAGNFFKQLVIDDGTSAIQVNVDAYDLYESYQYGQRVVIDVTGLYIGAYGKLMQIGAAPSGNAYPSRIATADMEAHAQVDGLASPDDVKVSTITVAELTEIQSNTTYWLDWQCRPVRIENVTFNEAGRATLAEANANTSRTLSDGTGSIILYTSGYSDFWDYYCPEGTGTVEGILSFYNNSWQIRLNSIEGLQGYELSKESTGGSDQPGDVTGNGSEATPFSVADVISGASGTDVWTKCYIVGWVEGQVLSEGAHFSAESSVNTNLLVADTPDQTDLAKCVPVQLPSGNVRTKLNLKDNPANYKKEVMLKGSLEKYFGVAGIKSVTEYKMEGGDDPEPNTPAEVVTSLNENFASGSLTNGWIEKTLGGTNHWYCREFESVPYATATGYKGSNPPFDMWLISPPVDMDKVEKKVLTFETQVNGYGSKTTLFEVYVLTSDDPATATQTKLTAKLPTAPASGYSAWTGSGDIDLSKFTGKVYIAFRYYATTDANYATWDVTNIKLNAN